MRHKEMLKEPQHILIGTPGRLLALLKDKIPGAGPRAYVCTTGVCERPADTLHDFIDLLEDQQLQR